MTVWAKAPPHGDPMGTLSDEHEYLTSGLTPVACAACTTEVLVRKASREHMSIQWQSSPADSCPEFAARVAAGELSARIDTCPRLREAIERAVATGAVAVPE
ncbi:hypothetical protein [Actinophytocola sp.]|uniref:hypothetical protein n=1 Tax=Actinophytocola sp. TaxID=1872138 RepID=UPI002ED0DBAB